MSMFLFCTYCKGMIRDGEPFAHVRIFEQDFYLHNDNSKRPNTCLHQWLEKKGY